MRFDFANRKFLSLTIRDPFESIAEAQQFLARRAPRIDPPQPQSLLFGYTDVRGTGAGRLFIRSQLIAFLPLTIQIANLF